MKTTAVGVLVVMVISAAFGLNTNGLNTMNMNNNWGMNGLNGNMNNNWNGLNGNMNNNWNGLNGNMNNLNGMNMNNWNGLNGNMNNNWNGLNSNMNNWNGMNGMNGMNMNNWNLLNTNMRNINGGRVDDPARMSEGIYDDATAISGKGLMMPDAPHHVSVLPLGDGSNSMTSSVDGVMIVASSADDPTEGRVIVSGGESIGMLY